MSISIANSLCCSLGLYEYLVWQMDFPPFFNRGKFQLPQEKLSEPPKTISRNALFINAQLNALPHFLGAYCLAKGNLIGMKSYFGYLSFFTVMQT